MFKCDIDQKFCKIFARVFNITIIASLVFLTACRHSNNSQIYTVNYQTVPHTLTYKSRIQPLEVTSVQTPSDGVIERVFVNFGELAQKNQILLNLNSPKYVTDYQNAMLAYLKAKDDYVNAKNSFDGTEELLRNGLVAREEYNSRKSSLANSYAVYLQQEQALRKFLPPDSKIDPHWSLEDKARVFNIFSATDNVVHIYAPMSGVVMGPLKNNANNNASNESAITRLIPGMEVHQGDSLLTLADLHGFTFLISVSEMDIDSIQEKMPATITSDAFSEVLHGYVRNVGVQAKPTNNSDSATPEFSVEVVVPKIDPAILKQVRLGMSVKVEIDLGSPKELLIPLSAIGNEHGKDVVKKVTSYGQEEITSITTGSATMDQVSVISGLKPGDKIRVPY